MVCGRVLALPLLCCMLTFNFFLTLDSQCTIHLDCSAPFACIKGKCTDPCGEANVCGTNATCSVVNHQASCSCPDCYFGQPTVKCELDNECNPPEPKQTICQSHLDCADNKVCEPVKAICVDPCADHNCGDNKRCEVRRHRHNCICKFGFILNSAGEFICAGDNIECRRHEDCSSELACTDNKCKNPCEGGQLCPADKTCVMMNHQPICLCLEECNPSVEICLRDEGCPANMACVSYQCVDPCESHSCAGDSPCYVEEHKPLCKFCPTGFTIDSTYGCVKGNKYASPFILKSHCLDKLMTTNYNLHH